MTANKVVGILTSICLILVLAIACGQQPDEPQREPVAEAPSVSLDYDGRKIVITRLPDGTRCATVSSFHGTSISCDWGRADLYVNVEEDSP